MPTYVSLLTFTDQGIKNIKETTKRYESAKTLGEKFGVKITQMLYTMGKYDCIAIADAKDEESFSAFILAAGTQGNVRTLSMRAYTPGEMQTLLGKI